MAKKKRARKTEDSIKRKISLVLKNLISFVILFVLSLVLYSVSSNEMYKNLFEILAMVLGFVSLAFLILLLVFVFMRIFRK